MTTLTVDAQLRSKLLDFSEPLNLCDETGRVVGRFTPVSTAPPVGYSEAPLSKEEWKRRREEPGCRIEEILAKLERL